MPYLRRSVFNRRAHHLVRYCKTSSKVLLDWFSILKENKEKNTLWSAETGIGSVYPEVFKYCADLPDVVH